MDDKSRLSYWFPVIEKAGLPVPKTEIIKASSKDFTSLLKSLDTGTFPDDTELSKAIAESGRKMGEPFFLRTDHFSGKHDWRQNCFVQSADDVGSHIYNIHEMWNVINFVAPPADIWVVREMLPTIPYGICEDYGDMPICKEFRIFVEDEKVLCVHPYWPLDSLKQGAAKYNDKDFCYEKFCDAGSDMDYIKDLASKAGKALGGAWSIDLLETANGWYLTDMAEARRSWHWPGCVHGGVE